MTASEIADWWDTQHEDYKDLLQEYVDANPGVFRAGVATLATIPTELGAGLVDALRFGQGLAEGTPGGVGTDVLRLLALAGPLGRVSRYISSSGVMRLAIHLKDPAQTAGICTWVAAAKALRQSGAGQLFAKVEDIAKLMGEKVPMGSLPSMWADDLVPAIRALGGKVKSLGPPTDFAHLERTAQAHLGRFQSMLFAVKWTTPEGQAAGHTLYMFKDGLGRLRISDRTGHVVKKLIEYEKLVPGWKGIGQAQVMTSPTKGAMLLITGPQMLYIDAATKLSALMMPLVRLIAVNTEEVSNLQQLDADFKAFVEEKRGGGKVVPPAPTPAPAPAGPLPPIYYLTGVQARLMHLGFLKSGVNGKHDAASKAAVIAFQKQYPPLRVDGIPGPKTQGKLRQVFGR